MIIKVSIGEVLDKISILKLKKAKISDSKALENVENELAFLIDTMAHSSASDSIDTEWFRELSATNAILWDVEDSLRAFERQERFDSEFIDLARSVYKLNDRRAKIKRELNLFYDSEFTEEKSYQSY